MLVRESETKSKRGKERERGGSEWLNLRGRKYKICSEGRAQTPQSAALQLFVNSFPAMDLSSQKLH